MNRSDKSSNIENSPLHSDSIDLELIKGELNQDAPTEIPLESLNQEIQKLNSKPLEMAEKEKYFLSVMQQQQAEIKIRMREPITFADPILWWTNIPLIFPNTINLIQGQHGSHKSRLAALLCSALLASEPQLDRLEIRRNEYSQPALLYVDTERNLKEQLPAAMQSIIRHAGYPIGTDLPNFYYVSLVDFKREDRFKALKVQLYHLRQSTETPIVVVLDVLTDCVTDFNRTDASMALIDLMNMYINQFDVTFICVIHENPGANNKARGHLGTESVNKATTAMQIGYEKDGSGNETGIIRVKFLKCRNIAKPKPIHLVYDPGERGLVFADQSQIQSIVQERAPKAQTSDIVDELETGLVKGDTKQKELVKTLAKRFNASHRTIKERLNRIEEEQMVIHSQEGKLCRLISRKAGREVIYSLEEGQVTTN